MAFLPALSWGERVLRGCCNGAARAARCSVWVVGRRCGAGLPACRFLAGRCCGGVVLAKGFFWEALFASCGRLIGACRLPSGSVTVAGVVVVVRVVVGVVFVLVVFFLVFLIRIG